MGDPVKAPLTVEQAFLQLMQSPEGRELASACFYGRDVVAECRRFESGEEWGAVSRIIGKRKLSGLAMDLGAGNGIASYALAKLGFRVISVEPDPSPLVGYGALNLMAAETGLPITHFVSHGECLEFADETFDLVYTRQVLHHASNLRAMISEVSRVLKPGGYLIACREHVIDNKESLDAFLNSHPLQQFTYGEFAYTLEEYKTAIRQSGMLIEEVYGSWDSVINFFPVSCQSLRGKMKRYASSRYFGLGIVFPFIPWWRKRYKRLKSAADKTPGRMHSFIVKKPAV